jgi:hypothetical protein
VPGQLFAGAALTVLQLGAVAAAAYWCCS